MTLRGTRDTQDTWFRERPVGASWVRLFSNWCDFGSHVFQIFMSFVKCVCKSLHHASSLCKDQNVISQDHRLQPLLRMLPDHALEEALLDVAPEPLRREMLLAKGFFGHTPLHVSSKNATAKALLDVASEPLRRPRRFFCRVLNGILRAFRAP